jgi:phosphoribosylaminoimidazole carboxylase PurE protein
MAKQLNHKVTVGVVMGSDSDWPLMEDTAKTLKEFGIHFEVRVLSAHRTPELAAEYALSARDRGLKVLIAAAGGAAHLAGVIAAHTLLPVIGIPVKGGALDGLDALLSTVQMPAGIPVATVALGRSGAVNAALLAVQILALNDAALADRLAAHKQELCDKVAKGNERVQIELAKLYK